MISAMSINVSRGTESTDPERDYARAVAVSRAREGSSDDRPSVISSTSPLSPKHLYELVRVVRDVAM